MKQYGGTGVQQCINRAVFELLDYIVLYPVEDENKFTDRKGVILPDAFLMKRGSTARDLAFRVHSDIGKSFLFAIDGKTKMRLGEKHELKDGDVIKIVSTK
jgi:ribosome-binding ATPase YchF (GTP1/OBG family)